MSVGVCSLWWCQHILRIDWRMLKKFWSSDFYDIIFYLLRIRYYRRAKCYRDNGDDDTKISVATVLGKATISTILRPTCKKGNFKGEIWWFCFFTFYLFPLYPSKSLIQKPLPLSWSYTEIKSIISERKKIQMLSNFII